MQIKPKIQKFFEPLPPPLVYERDNTLYWKIADIKKLLPPLTNSQLEKLKLPEMKLHLRRYKEEYYTDITGVLYILSLAEKPEVFFQFSDRYASFCSISLNALERKENEIKKLVKAHRDRIAELEADKKDIVREAFREVI